MTFSNEDREPDALANGTDALAVYENVYVQAGQSVPLLRTLW